MVTKTLARGGVERAMQMPCPPLPGATGDTETNLAIKAQTTLAFLQTHDFVALHVGGPDEATHRQDPVEKAAFIARADKEMLAPILAECPAGTRVLLTCDHAALCSTAGHTTEPVRALLWQKGTILSGDKGLLSGRKAIPPLMGNAP